MTAARNVRAWLGGWPATDRVLALVGATVLIGSSLVAPYQVVDVVGEAGGLELFVAVAVGAVALAAVLARLLPVRAALGLGGLLLVAGLGMYALAIPEGTLDLAQKLQDTIALLTGLSVLRMTRASLWAIGFTPGPLFLSTYLFLRRRYVLGVLVGGGTLAFFISTGDISVLHGLVGTLGAIAALGFGRLDHEGATRGQRDTVVVLLVAVLVVTTSLSAVPGGAAQPLLPDEERNTLEASLVGGGDRITVQGSIELSPTVQFTVEADRPARWRSGAFDRYTGNGWVRAGQSQPYEGSLGRPAGAPLDPLRQTVEVHAESGVMPAAWKPIRVTDGADRVRVTSMRGLEPRRELAPGDQYSVVSIETSSTAADLRAAGTDYPEGVVERYTQLPDSTPDRVEAFTTELTADATTPYDTARVIEEWLEANKAYSLEVDRPRGDVAAGFIFEMDRGYCTYYATAMVAMLRTQGIPARFVTGYTTGESVGDNRWEVRGLDSHAWVEVYYPGHGWVAFDPTPAGPRQNAEQAVRDQAEGDGVTTAESPVSTPEALTPGSDGLVPTTVSDDSTGGDQGAAGTLTIPPGMRVDGGAAGGSSESGGGPGLPDEETVLYGLILLVGAATAAHRTGVFVRGRRFVWVRRRPVGAPSQRIEATFERLDYLLGRRYRPRRPGETPRTYLRNLRLPGGRDKGSASSSAVHDHRLDRLFELYERSRYAGRVSAADADRAWQLFAELREKSTARG